MDDPKTASASPHSPGPDLARATDDPAPRRHRLTWPLAVVAIALVAGVWLMRGDPQPSSPGARRLGVAIPVVGVEARRGSIGVYVDGLGTVTPLATVTVRSRVDGQLIAVHYKEGELVRQGDLLAEIDPRPYQVQLEQAEGQLTRDQALLENARTDLVRYQDLVRQNATPEQQVATQKALVAQYDGAIKTDQGAIASAKLNLTYSRITAPLTGRIGLRLVDPGNIVHASDAGGLLVITEVRPISVVFSIAEDRLPPVLSRIRSGATLRVDAYDRAAQNKLASGRLFTIDNLIDPSTGTLKFRALFDNAHDELFPNQFVNARLLVEEKQGVTLIPTAAVERNGQATYVWLVKKDSTVTVRPITVGVSEGFDTEVTSGLAPGDLIVMTGVDKLQDGVKVHLQTGGGPSKPPQAQ